MDQWHARLCKWPINQVQVSARDNGSVTKVYNPTEKLDDPNFEWVCAQTLFVVIRLLNGC